MRPGSAIKKARLGLRALMIAVTAAAGLAAVAMPARAASPFAGLDGSWSGGGRVQFEGGQTEALRCTAYYTPSGGGAHLGLALRCASASNKIDLRGRLSHSGGRIAGDWEERTYNAQGTAVGSAGDGRIVLRLTGPISGSMSVAVSRNRQTISITTQGTAIRGVQIALKRR